MGKLDHTLIFIVEDEHLYSRAVMHALEAKSFVNVRLFSTGEDALEHMHLKPEIVLLDLRLGEGRMDGLEVLHGIHKHSPETQVVFLTAVDNLEIATETIKSGAYDYVVKNESAFERVKNILRRIVFENQIKQENRLLRRSRRIILTVFALLVVTVIVLAMVHFL
jgi:DNA-binding NtrC family response regulator